MGTPFNSMDGHLWMRSFARCLNLFAPKGSTVVDLGCCEGGFSVEIARMGYQVLGIEVREEHIERCHYLKDNCEKLDLEFIQSDVSADGVFGEQDIVLCCGLLYHIKNPTSFLQRICSLARRMIILQTHFAPMEGKDSFHLSPLTEHEGSAGRWYRDDPVAPLGGVGVDSFWLTRAEIVRILRQSGCVMSFEVLDTVGETTDAIPAEMYGGRLRATIVGVKA